MFGLVVSSGLKNLLLGHPGHLRCLTAQSIRVGFTIHGLLKACILILFRGFLLTRDTLKPFSVFYISYHHNDHGSDR
jgi:hypothetical protein